MVLGRPLSILNAVRLRTSSTECVMFACGYLTLPKILGFSLTLNNIEMGESSLNFAVKHTSVEQTNVNRLTAKCPS